MSKNKEQGFTLVEILITGIMILAMGFCVLYFSNALMDKRAEDRAYPRTVGQGDVAIIQGKEHVVMPGYFGAGVRVYAPKLEQDRKLIRELASSEKAKITCRYNVRTLTVYDCKS
jgi:hypothetical protein